MSRHTQILAMIVVGTVVAACGTTERVNFVTTTSIGIQGDTRTADATIGYNRFEGVIGPAYETGALPPVAGALRSDLEIFNPSIDQVYATGDAARVVTGGRAKSDELDLTGEKRVMVFGTGTNLGIKLGFGTAGPESIVFGYKRIEFSSLPIGVTEETEGEKKQDRYGSVLAAVSLDVDGDLITDKNTRLAQLFASGQAAVNLAGDGELRKLFRSKAEAILKSDLSCPGGNAPDDNSQKIRDFLRADRETNDALLQQDMKLLGIGGVPVPSLLNCKDYTEHREMIAARRG